LTWLAVLVLFQALPVEAQDPQAMGPEGQPEAAEVPVGLSRDQPISRVVERFNQEARAWGRTWRAGRNQPDLTSGELVAAIRWAIHTGSREDERFQAKCRRIVATGMLPKGSRLVFDVGAATFPGATEVLDAADVARWQIYLIFAFDENAPSSTQNSVLVRLQFLGAGE
jgi:hypothetical protein